MSPRRAVVGYVRLSRESEESTSVDRQREIIASACRARDLDLIETVEDVDVSATKRRLDRPGLDRVRALIHAKKADAVVVWRLDRLARSVVDFGILLDEGLQVISATEPLDTTSPMGRAMAEVLQVFAALEARTIGERVRSARSYRVANLRWPGGSAPYGYRSIPHESGDGRALEVDPEEARFIRRAADLVLSGSSLYAATETLNREGSTPRRASRWSLTSLRIVLTGDSVLGRMTRDGALLRDEHGLPVAVWEPVLPLEDVERLRALLAPRKAAERRRRASRLLSGLLVCSSCGTRLRVNITGGKSKVTRYACQGKSDGPGCTRPVSVTAARIEDFVSASFLETMGDVHVTEEQRALRDVAGLAEVEEAIRHTAAEMASPTADIPALVERLQALRARREALDSAPLDDTTLYVVTGHTYAEAWDTADVAERRALIASQLVRPIVLYPGERGRHGLDPARVGLAWLADD